MLLVCACACALAAAWLLVGSRWHRVRHYWSRRGVPHSPPHPLLGSLTFLQKQNPGLWMRDMYDRFRSPYVGIWLFWRPAIIVNSPDIARRILVKDFDVFRDRFMSSGTKDPIGGRNLLTVNDPLWSEMRKRVTAMFTAARLRSLQGFIQMKSKEMVQRIEKEMEKNGQVELRTVFSDYTTDVIGTTSFGIASDATLTGNSALRTVTKDFMKFSVYRGLCWSCIFFLPELVDIFRFSFFPRSAVQYFRKVYHEIVAQRGGYGNSSTEHNDLIDMLRKIKQEYNENNKDIEEDTLIAQAAIFLQGGFDTTSNALAFVIIDLSFLPDLQEKLYNELQEVINKNGSSDLDPSALNELVLMQCVLKESLRMFPSMGWLDRVASRDYQIDDKLKITAGTPVYINAIGMHYDPDIFPEPFKFNPDRFLPENEKDVQPYTFMPFGDGPRSCIGRRFATQNFLTALSNIILNYKILPALDAKLLSEIEIEKRGFFLMPGEKIYARFIPRKI